MAELQNTKKIEGGKPLPVKASGVKNASVYDLVYTDKGMNYIFKPSQGKLTAPAGSASTNNFQIISGGNYSFTPDATTYFGVDQKGKSGQITKAEFDAQNAKEVAVTINSAATAAVDSEKIKGSNIKKIALYTAGISLLVSAIAYGFYRMNKAKPA
jgi:hypothetical protein